MSMSTSMRTKNSGNSRSRLSGLSGLKRLALGFATMALVLACGTSTAFAVDGVVLIDQNRALAGNVTPGDAPGFPVTLSQPGSYRLSGNLTVPHNLDGILIATDHVTLDLNGFTIAGGGNKNGVFNGFVGRLGTVVRNGTVTNFDNGVFLKENDGDLASSEIQQIKALKNLALGILAGANSIVVGNTAIGNDFFGIGAGSHSIVRDNISTGNSTGLALVGNVVASGNNAFGNSFAGVVTTCPSVFIGNGFVGLVVQDGIGCFFDPLP
jgi:hypothetical protein